jgi:hypothetical protein
VGGCCHPAERDVNKATLKPHASPIHTDVCLHFVLDLLFFGVEVDAQDVHTEGVRFKIENLFQLSTPPKPSAIGEMMPQSGFGGF